MAAVLVQEKLLTGGATSSAQVVSFDSPVSSGNSVILVHQGGVATITVSDTANGSYGSAVVSRADGSKQVSIYAKHAISSGGFTGLTLQAGAAFFSKPAIFEVSGLDATSTSGSNELNSSVFALSSTPLTGNGFACGGLATGSGLSSPTIEVSYTSTNDGFGLTARGSSASHAFSNTQCTGRANGIATTQISALAIFNETGSAAVGLRAGMRLLFGMGR